jgi:hypothetical protein
MVAATLWYAWPQALYSLVPLYDLLRYFFPQWTQPLGPWIDSLRGAAGG